MPVITLVTVALNDLAGLKRTLASLANQTYRDAEHVVIDGGSTDGSAEWVRQNSVFPNTIVASETDRGIYDAMNKGLRLANGEIVCFLNSGDCFAAPNVLERVVGSYRSERWAWAFGKGQLVDEKFVPTRRPSRARYSWRHQTFWHYDVTHQAVFAQAKVLRTLGGFDERYSVAADYHLMTRLGRRYPPTVWPWTVALNLEGGVSVQQLTTTYWQIHSARVAALGMKRALARLDAAWTVLQITRAGARRLVRRLVGTNSRRKAIRDMASRGPSAKT